MDATDVVSALEAKQRALKEELARIQASIADIRSVVGASESKKSEKGTIPERAIAYLRKAGSPKSTTEIALAIHEKYAAVFSALDRKKKEVEKAEQKGSWRLKG